MELLAVLPTENPRVDPKFLIDASLHAEQLGFAGVRMPDHLLPPPGSTPELGAIYDPFVTLSHIAARTERITLGTSVLILPLRNPFAVAKQSATLARLSGSRFIRGVGVGWIEQEFQSVGANFQRRGRHTDESLRLIRHLHSVGHGPFESDTYPFTSGEFTPTLETPVPILVGGVSRAALRRAARFADIWESYDLEFAEFENRVEYLRSCTDRTIQAGVNVKWNSDTTSLDDFLGQMASWQRAGADSIAVHFGPAAGMLERMESLMDSFTDHSTTG